MTKGKGKDEGIECTWFAKKRNEYKAQTFKPEVLRLGKSKKKK
tara:strand:+ start:222 stop:350 length:129 start_codon:yes stop_codon:yes gene_type:complete